MGPTDGTVIVIALFALIIVAAFLVFRLRGKVKIKGPLGTGLELDATNEMKPPTPAVRVEGAESRSGGLLANDRTGRGAEVKDVKVEADIRVSSSLPKERRFKIHRQDITS
jgi:hypothetical protein